MDWPTYQKRFVSIAQSQGRAQTYIDQCLTYAKALNARGLPIIYNPEHLGTILGYRYQALVSASENPKPHYITYDIPKRNGGKRTISEPKESLKFIQRWILDNILHVCPVHFSAMAFRVGFSIKNNAIPHVDQPMVLSLDMIDFFSSIRSEYVSSIFKEMGYEATVAKVLTGLTTLHSCLPQGAPTSPALSNLAFTDIDASLYEYAVKLGIHYTRYADDMTFSGKFDPGSVICMCRQILRKHNQQLNEGKTRLMLPHQRQEVTGVVVNKHIQAPRTVRRQLRQESYYVKKYGFASHSQRCHSLYANRLDHLRGLAEFVLFLNKGDRDAASILAVLGKYGTALPPGDHLPPRLE